MRGERRGGKDGGEGKPAKRGEGQSKLLKDRRAIGRRTNAHKASRAASPRSTAVQAKRPRCGRDRLTSALSTGRRPWRASSSNVSPRAGNSRVGRGRRDGISATGQFGPQGLGADDGDDDLRRQGKFRQGRQSPARRRAQADRHRRRRRRQSDRHGGRLFRRRLGGADRRGDGAEAQARHADRDQGALSDGGGAERSRPFPLASDPRLRGEPQAAARPTSSTSIRCISGTA